MLGTECILCVRARVTQGYTRAREAVVLLSGISVPSLFILSQGLESVHNFLKHTINNTKIWGSDFYFPKQALNMSMADIVLVRSSYFTEEVLF